MPTFRYEDEGIFVVEDFYTAEECDELIEFSEGLGYEDAPITTAQGFEMMPEIRNNLRVIVDDVQRAQQLWEKSREYFAQELGDWRVCGVNERFRFYRYQPGQYFRKHLDGAYQRSRSERSFWTFMIYLNDDFEGGETLFPNACIKPTRGSALFFLHQQFHEGAEVLSGTKYVLRTDVMFRRFR